MENKGKWLTTLSLSGNLTANEWFIFD